MPFRSCSLADRFHPLRITIAALAAYAIAMSWPWVDQGTMSLLNSQHRTFGEPLFGSLGHDGLLNSLFSPFPDESRQPIYLLIGGGLFYFTDKLHELLDA